MRTKTMGKALAFLAIASALFFTACDPDAIWGSGDVITESRSAANFDGIETSIPGEIHLTQGA